MKSRQNWDKIYDGTFDLDERCPDCGHPFAHREIDNEDLIHSWPELTMRFHAMEVDIELHYTKHSAYWRWQWHIYDGTAKAGYESEWVFTTAGAALDDCIFFAREISI